MIRINYEEKTKPDIAIVIPLYNKGLYIARALNSVIGQTIQNFEVIVVDDGSTDNGAYVVKGFGDPRIRLIQQGNRGVSASRNRGVGESAADFITFLDADDEWLPKHLEIMSRLKKDYPAAGAYATAYQFYQPDGQIKLANFKAIPDPPWEGVIPSYFKSDALGDHPLCSSSVGIPRKIFYEVGGFLTDVRYGEDEDLWGKIALRYPIVFSWQVGAIYHLDATNRACDNIPLEEEAFVKTARLEKLHGNVKAGIEDDLNEFLARKEIDLAKLHVQRGYPKAALEILAHCNTRLLLPKKILWTLLALMPTFLFRYIRIVKKALI